MSFFVSPGLCEPPFLVPILLWVFRNIYDRLLGSDLLQPALHLCPPHHIWRVGERRIRGDPPAAAGTLPERSAVRGKCSTEICQQMQCLLKARVTPLSWAHTLWDSQDSCLTCLVAPNALYQWFSDFLMPFYMVPHVVLTPPTIKLFHHYLINIILLLL